MKIGKLPVQEKDRIRLQGKTEVICSRQTEGEFYGRGFAGSIWEMEEPDDRRKGFSGRRQDIRWAGTR